MSDSPSLELGLRMIRRARIRAWFLAIALVPVCILTSVLLPAQWINLLPLDGRCVAGPFLYVVVLSLYLMYVADLLCPRCGKRCNIRSGPTRRCSRPLRARDRSVLRSITSARGS